MVRWRDWNGVTWWGGVLAWAGIGREGKAGIEWGEGRETMGKTLRKDGGVGGRRCVEKGWARRQGKGWEGRDSERKKAQERT